MIRSALPILLIFVLTMGTATSSAQSPSKPRLGPPAHARLSDSKRSAKIGRALTVLHEEYAAHVRTKSGQPFRPGNRWLEVHGGTVVIDAAAHDAAALRTALEALGLRGGATFGRVVSGRLPITALDELTRIDGLRFARPSYAATQVGLTTSQGDDAMFADFGRAVFGVDGSGVTVGTLSDSYDCLGGAAADVASGDLPPGVVVLMEDPACGSVKDEGRGMMQLIADVAPGAGQAFHTANGGQAAFAVGILALASAAGADVIVDDVIYPTEPMFQDGIIAQAVDLVVESGVPYFSSAGNNGRDAYEDVYRPAFEPITGLPAHDFDPGAGTDVYQRFTLPEDTAIRLSFQWDSPYFSASLGSGSPNDVDVLVFDDPPTTLLAFAADGNVGADPVEVLEFFNPPASGITRFNLALGHFSGPSPGYVKYVLFELGGSIDEHLTASGTLFGHANAAGAEAVGAAPYFMTPRFGVSPAFLETFSSAGPMPIFFDASDAPILDVRDKPEIVAPDGTNTTFFGDGDLESDGFPNFFGTSAAAPHAAAVAALLLELHPGLSPGGVYSALESTADDMGPAGFDSDSGFGLVQADVALGAVVFADGFESGNASAWSSAVP